MWGGAPGRFSLINYVVVVWRTHRGGSVSPFFGERSESPIYAMLTLNLLCVMRRYTI